MRNNRNEEILREGRTIITTEGSLGAMKPINSIAGNQVMMHESPQATEIRLYLVNMSFLFHGLGKSNSLK